MPMTTEFEQRLYPILPQIAAHYGTPFHIYDEVGIRDTGRQLLEGFARLDGFQEFFAVKALPNPEILKLMAAMGFGFDCSSVAELTLCRQIGAGPEQLMFTSNNTSAAEFEVALQDGGCILNLDDISLLEKVPQLPELLSFRYNPGPRRTGNDIIGNPVEAKYGVSYDQLEEAYRRARDRGVKHYGLHTMLASNELNYTYMVATAEMLLEEMERLSAALGIQFAFVNIGGGLGIPYQPDAKPLNFSAMADEITARMAAFKQRNGYMPHLYLESGRYMTGPHGVLVTAAINRKEIYRTYVGVDANMSALMRPGMYGAYHHITVLGKPAGVDAEVVDVTGSLCENNDKFAIQRRLPPIREGDLLCIHDTGAHGHAMGFNYNGKLRPKELLLRQDGSVALIRRAETLADHFATLKFEPDELAPERSHPVSELRN
ncbi:MAG: diaminopimelate decarboxylase [Desulfosarcinaceae bacterium]|nr:diaminopimelate decarboxylase [Desulfosarcinaceae bacterium]